MNYKRNRSRRRYPRISAATGRERSSILRPLAWDTAGELSEASSRARKPWNTAYWFTAPPYEIGGENYFAAMMAFASRHRTCEWREKLAAAAQPEIPPETYLYVRALKEKGKYENQSEKQVGEYLRHRRQFGLHFSPARVKAIVAAIEADDTATLATDQPIIHKEK